ncbi:TonB-dependent receptor domain-containing protein [Alteromonas lipolytica]|uniref:TonB-dependent receptor domain-containing protein n=1 Tax=Alteromonas lipolytica TaxID=1856405 RepID=UPI0009F36F35|nr:TonB-dependent receptor [Alteromonas lipolytica]
MNLSQAIAAQEEQTIEVQQAEQSAAVVAEQPQTEKPADDEPEHILVTGSRLQFGNVTSKPTVITAEDIQKRGVSSVTELIRTLPQNLATIGGLANNRFNGPLAPADGSASNMSSIGALGVSAANLGGMGAGRTLILINGRRMAGAAGIEDGFVNLNGIPLSAIERVEITTDGASAVYGADAMGGVINFILKSGYSGSSVTVQHEDSNNGADFSRLSVYTGYGWKSGNVSVVLDYSERDPVVNAKTGYVTNNYAPYFNGDSTYDRRSFASGAQPGLIDISESSYNWETGEEINYIGALTLPAGFEGRPEMSDFVEVGEEAYRDFVPRLGGPKSENSSIVVNFEQNITDKLQFTADALFTRNKNTQNQLEASAILVNMAPGQYYNPFPEYYFSSWDPGTVAYYYPGSELANGDISYGYSENTTDNWSVNLGLTYQFDKETRLDLAYTTSRTTNKGNRYGYESVVSISTDYNTGGWSCYNFMIQNNRYQGEQATAYQNAFDAQCEVLTSADPDIAFNPWRTGADGAGGSIDPFFFGQESESRGSRLENFEIRLNGALTELPAGKVYYVIGGEYNDDGVDSREVRASTGERVNKTREALFAEMSIPVFGKDLHYPGFEALTLSIAARRDSYSTDGAIGTVDDVPYDQGGQIIYGENTFSRTTPSIGIKWTPVEDITLRARWSEGFQAPEYTSLFNVNGTDSYNTSVTNDPYYDCREFNSCDFDWGSSYGYYVPRITTPNPDLKPQTSKQQSYTLSWNPSGVLSGLTVDVTYNNTKIENEIATLDTLNTLLPFEELVSLEAFYPRDEDGKVAQAMNRTFNISGSEYESIMYTVGYYVYTSFGSFEPRLTYLDNRKSERKAFADSTPISSLGFLQGVDDYKITGQLTYNYQDFSASLFGYYMPDYINDYIVRRYAGVISNPDYAIEAGAYMTFDLTASYQVTNQLQVTFAGRNIFDREPPLVVVGSLPYDDGRYNVEGRTLSLQLQYEF